MHLPHIQLVCSAAIVPRGDCIEAGAGDGVHYRLHLENHGGETHEFKAPAFFAAATIDNPDVLSNAHSEVLMQPGDKKDVFLTPRTRGTYDLRCADWYGTVGGITVK